MQPSSLEATKLAHFSPYATSALQPIDQGVVYSIEVAYRTRLILRLLFDMQAKGETKIDVKFPVGILPADGAQLKSNCVTPNPRNFLGFDNAIIDNKQLTDDEIVAFVNNASERLLKDDSGEEAEASVQLFSTQATNYIKALKGYFLKQQGDCPAEVLLLSETQHKIKQPAPHGKGSVCNGRKQTRYPLLGGFCSVCLAFQSEKAGREACDPRFSSPYGRP
ncbi:hypothetical protein HPB51_007783 [Rhipicephalus microplus]|uniref:Uncharacterized protein n=1 Tax=Rhipicephalus microplus TaxID=6941 RepID=A0A9J6EZD0_RHIMP|nr:hypothetical protein HPB51_007783 [Rhipicephalus microplus]